MTLLTKKPINFIGIFLGLIILSLGCSDAKETLDPLSENTIVENRPTNLTGEFCTLESDKIKSHLKIIFVIDKSGSNERNLDDPGTDTDGSRRYTAIEQFINAYASDPTVYFSLINFSTQASLIQPFTNNADNFLQVIQHEHNPNNDVPPRPVDQGWTNFQGTLEKVKAVISDDIELAKKQEEIVSSFYVVFFISDGAPYVNGNELANLQDKTTIINTVESIVVLGQEERAYVDGVNMHTGYYYNTIKSDIAETYMSEIAKKGNGTFMKFSEKDLIRVEEFSVPTRIVKHNLRDVFVESLNSVWSEGSLQYDMDGDGISNVEEIAFGSNSAKEDSDDNGVSDGVEKYALGKPCKDAKCAATGAESFLACMSFLPATNSKLSVVRGYTDKDKDGLNDCEEQVLLKSKTDDFDSNADWIPDELAFRNKIAFVEHTPSEANLDPDGDGLDNITEMKKGTPIHYNNKSIFKFNPISYILKEISDDEKQTCYSLKVNDISTVARKQKFRLVVVENSSIIDSKRYLRMLDVELTEGQTTKFLRSQLP